MKVLQVITSLRVGGAEILVTQLAVLMRSSGIDVDVALFDGYNSPLSRKLKDSGINVYSFSARGSIYNPIHILRLIRLVNKYDIVHTHNTAAQYFVAIASLFSCSTFITTEHSSSNHRRNSRWFPKFLDRWMYSRYKKIICISDKTASNLISYLDSNNSYPIQIIRNGISVHDFYSAHPYDRTSFCQESVGRFVIVMVAGFRYEKDQDTIIKAISLLPKDQFMLWLVGDGARKSVLEGLVKELCVSDMVRFWGIRDDVERILHTADAVIMSSHFEGLSLSSIEGMCVGKPFIASDVDGLREITEGAGLLFPHEDYSKLADLLFTLSQDTALCHRISNDCFRKASYFDITKTAKEYIDMYRSEIPAVS